MTQDEVDLIYDYLHENYKYYEGNLIVVRTKRGGCKVGSSIGSFNYKRTSGSPILSCSLTIEGRRFNMQLKHLIYIYHHKEKPRNIYFLDKNPMNCAIENLMATKSLNKFIQQKENYAGKSGATPYSYKGTTRYRVRLSTEEGRFTIGSYNDEKIATKVYDYSRNLYLNKSLSNEDIKKEVQIKFPSKKHKKISLPGVSLAKSNRFKSILIINKFRKHIGTFDTQEEAYLAYLKAKEEYETAKTIPTTSR